MMDLDLYKLNDLKRVQDEILKKEDRIQSFYQIMYSAIVLILGYSIAHKNPLLSLIPFFIIWSIYNITNDINRKVCRMAAYIIVFYGEAIAPEWEKRLHTYTKEQTKENFSKRKPWAYILLPLSCSLIFGYTRSQYIHDIKNIVDLDYIDQFISWDYSFYIILFLSICLIVYFYKERLNYQEEKDRCIGYWKKVKSQEDENN